MLNKLSRLLADAGISLTDHQKTLLVAYVDMLHKWNKAYNLTSVRDPNEMLVRHILDSIVVAPYLQGQRFIDVGTGPGLPGIPLAIVLPDAHFTLLDSLGKRVRFLRQVQHELKLENITPVQSRVEAYPSEPPFDGVISRAFASLNDMVSWCHHLLGEKGRFYALKGQLPGDEIASLPDNFSVESVEKLRVPQLEGERHLVIIKSNKV
ncbi:16S rRNA (guanine(527)-N(7))-methyltransferase RsmG [Salmonella enterica subsp. enterica serovar Uzaramo]|uniref:Ribosomal RNA small subunit methyltransferase G n=1 Tax=Salmonella enterica subsp. enterica serovar Uzaramo TaxID=2565147 RepID=A0A636KDW4_SALET|nr:16S rRNA (guanine(527)-N(7))-methyltransferase RsmG [Salmonella enterica]EBW5060696.1 16S rRNA (guanine(527)-N(7))-methyltransferase RsmG [Salmonella enterica subsp. enterica serovar Somone]EBZ9043460.1 16S rRNA (guanine(527)-N(7))-methyltransferase RsmG [Salmonella enterica subsp. enterica serovar Uzaramo]ECJ2029770.1 16S rRNA (guanine(527)-N(7))-methyltransferase RsmG [Salmonella enterica subsp. enterica serovar Ohio]EDB3930988.1 16S rRNA (guanine(527)-N(7))-methyltransferase RsmG [Salmone